MSKIYIAHNFAARRWLCEIVNDLEARGHEVTSRWIKQDSHADRGLSSQSAVDDLEDVSRADDLILFADNYGNVPGRGKYVEFGFALRAGKRIIVVGAIENWRCVFYYLPNVHIVQNLEEALPLLSGGTNPR